MAAFSSHDRVLEDEARPPIGRDVARELQAVDYDAEATAKRAATYQRVALQFPDELVPHAPAVLKQLSAAIKRRRVAHDATPKLFVLADTSFDGYQVDYVAAQHVDADLIVHYGPADLDADGPIDVRFVFGERDIDVDTLADAYSATFGAAELVVVVFALTYQHAAEPLARRLEHTGALVTTVNVDRCADEASVATAVAAPRSIFGRRLPRCVDDEQLGTLLYVGPDDQTLSNLAMLLPRAAVYRYHPQQPRLETGTCELRVRVSSPSTLTASIHLGSRGSGPPSCERLELGTARRLMRRYYLVNLAREARVVGVLVGSLSAPRRQEMLTALRRASRAAGVKVYTLLMGKLNAAKLANFAEIQAFVLLGSAEHSLVDSKDFLRPVVTPYEYLLALSGDEWTGEYELDYGRLLPRLEAAVQGAGGGGSGQGDDDDCEGPPPMHSLISGRLLGERGGGGSEAAGTGGALALRQEGGTLCTVGTRALGRSGADFLAHRAFRGLELRLGEDAPATLQHGRSGIASSFVGEGGGARAHCQSDDVAEMDALTDRTVPPASLNHPLS